MSDEDADPGGPPVTEEERASVGLCTRCRHARRIVSAKGSSFWLCRLSAADSRFRKYPRLPVLACTGHEAGVPE